MRVYFLCEKLCGLWVGGAYLGLADGFERAAELSAEDGLLCELKPLGDYLPLRFCLDGRFLLSPPPQISLYFSGGDVAVYAHDFVRADPSLSVLWQQRVGSALLTLTMQGKLQLILQTRLNFSVIPLHDELADCRAEPCGENFLLRGEKRFALLSPEGKILAEGEGKVLEAGETLQAEIPFHDSGGHTARCEWRGGELIGCTIRSAREPDGATLALALFESVLIGADCSPYLADALKQKAADLKEYLGGFRSVVLTDESDRVGLVYERAPRIYDVRYFRVDFEDGKISNIRPEKT